MIENSRKSVLIIGASSNPSRYSFRAIQILVKQGFSVIAVGKSGGSVSGVNIESKIPENCKPHTIAFYLNACYQFDYAESIEKLNPQRVIFNPGADNHVLAERFSEKGIQVVEACMLVMLSLHRF